MPIEAEKVDSSLNDHIGNDVRSAALRYIDDECSSCKPCNMISNSCEADKANPQNTSSAFSKITNFSSKLKNEMNDDLPAHQKPSDLIAHSESQKINVSPLIYTTSKLNSGCKSSFSKKKDAQQVIVLKSKSGAFTTVLPPLQRQSYQLQHGTESSSKIASQKKIFIRTTKNTSSIPSSEVSAAKLSSVVQINEEADLKTQSIKIDQAVVGSEKQSSNQSTEFVSSLINESKKVINTAIVAPSAKLYAVLTAGSPSQRILPVGTKSHLPSSVAEPPSIRRIYSHSESSDDSLQSECCAQFDREGIVDGSGSVSQSPATSDPGTSISIDLNVECQQDEKRELRQTEQSKMYGRYTRDLGDYAKHEAGKITKGEKYLSRRDSELRPYNRYHLGSICFPALRSAWKKVFARIGEDWVFLAVLGILMACISFLMDRGIGICNKARIWMYRDLAGSNVVLQYMSWIFLPICLILFSASFVHLMAPQSVGSGIPEMKTIMRGVVLKEYLTFKTLIAKIIGLTATLGTGLPLGKEGPFVHIASMVATLLSKAVTTFKGIYENESRNSEMLAAACAVGVACSFAAPIGGVLFSIEVTTTYFAVRNYWRGFFAAVCGAMMFRLLAVWVNDEETLTALFETSFKNNPYDSLELFAYAFVGVLCGFLGAFFVWVHRQYVFFMRKNKKMKAFLQKSRLLYPLIVTIVFGTLNFPPGFGMFVAGELTTHEQVAELFANISWTKEDPIVSEFKIIENWRSPFTNIFVNLILYFILTFTGCVVASTLPVPSGIFIPVFKMGASLGRLVGETMGVMFAGIAYRGIVPGGYSLVGAAAFSGAVTHTISTSVIVFELTGQITHIIPVMLAVLIANGIAQLLQPSIYDSIIQIKKLPYLPDIITSTAGAYHVFVEDFMVRNVKYIYYGLTYRELKALLLENRKIRSLPLVDSPDSMILLGSIQRAELITHLEQQMGRGRRSKVADKWKNVANKAQSAEKHSVESRLAEKVKNIDPEPHAMKYRKELNTFQAIDMPSSMRNIDIESDEDYPNSIEFNRTKSSVSIPMITTTTCSSQSSMKYTRNVDDLDLELEYTETAPMLDAPKRRPSRFAVTKVETVTPYKNESSVTLQVDPVEIPFLSQSMESNNDLSRSTLPRKSILKKTRSFTLNPSNDFMDIPPQATQYVTVHAGDSKLRQVIEAVLHKRSLISKLESRNMPKIAAIQGNGSPSSMHLNPVDPNLLWKKQMEMKKKWEEEELSKKVDFDKCQIDPAPFQLVERTSLLKVHSLFSMLGLNHAYVTAIGRLIGVVALKELRRAIEEANVGEFHGKSEGSCSELGGTKDSSQSSLKGNQSS